MHRALPFALAVSIIALPLTISSVRAAVAPDAATATQPPQIIYPSEQVSVVPDTDLNQPPPLAAPAPVKTPGVLGQIPVFGPPAKAAMAAATPAPAAPVAAQAAAASPSFPPPPASIANVEPDKTTAIAAAAKPAPADSAQLKIGHLAMVHAVKPKPAAPVKLAAIRPAAAATVDRTGVDQTLLTPSALHVASASDQNDFLAGRDIAAADDASDNTATIAGDEKAPPDAPVAAGAALGPPEDDADMTPMPADGRALQTAAAAQPAEPLAGPVMAPEAAQPPAPPAATLAEAAPQTDKKFAAAETGDVALAPPPPAARAAAIFHDDTVGVNESHAAVAPGPPIHHHAAEQLAMAQPLAPAEDDDDRLVARERAALASTDDSRPVQRVSAVAMAPAAVCRPYTRNVTLTNGLPARVGGTACRGSDHAWRITSEHLIAEAYARPHRLRVRYLRPVYPGY